VRSSCRIAVDRAPGGGTRFLTTAGNGALTPRRTGAERIHIVAGAAGPLGGDDLELDVRVGKGARLEVCSAAASIVLGSLPGPGPGPSRPDRPSRLRITADVAEGGELVLTPGTVLLTRRGHHRSTTEVTVAEGGRLLARELLVLGRSGETGGTGSFQVRLDVGGRPAVRQTVRLDREPGTTGPAVLAGARALGQLLVAGLEQVPNGTRGPRAGWLPSAIPGCAVFTVSSPDPAAAQRLLDTQALAAPARAA
jgi:urease accessory protein